MKRIVLCFDGTWNKPADENLPPEEQIETNVCRFYKSVHDRGSDGIEQVKWYDEGVGAHWFDRFSGGAFGIGLDTNIIEGYAQLADLYNEGDEVYILGFSRGAYTARSLVGMIRNCGLVTNNRFTKLQAATAYGIYRTRDDAPDSRTAQLFRSRASRPIKIKFQGVWDTVGALGIPLTIVEEFNTRFHEFHDTQLSRIVENAYQAVAIDEHRQHYDVCLWNLDHGSNQVLEQRWFAGAHSDVGGGYRDRRLSDLALQWMQAKAIAVGLGLSPVQVAENGHLAPYTDSYREFLKGKYARLYQPHFRRIGSAEFGNERVDDSVRSKLRDDRDYQPKNHGI